jgi:hypothetical protein
VPQKFIENLYKRIANLCREFKRPLSVLAIGAPSGDITLRLAEEFEGAFMAIDDPQLLQSFRVADNKKAMLLNKVVDLSDLIGLKEVQYFDVVLIFDKIHSFGAPHQKALNVIMSMCSHCFVWHEGDLNLTGHESLCLFVSCGTRRGLWKLNNTAPNTIDRNWFKTGTAYTGNKGITVSSDFAKVEIKYRHRDEHRDWIPGIDLKSFLLLGGVYPTKQQILSSIDSLDGNFKDLGPHNLILNGRKLCVIDQDDYEDPVNTPQKLKDHMKSIGLI